MTAPDADNRWGVRPFLMMGYVTLFLLVAGLGGWGAMARISGAIIAPGALEVEGNRQVVQHPTGGVIEAIHARDGDEVKAGDVLVELEGEAKLSELEIVEGQWFEVLARKSRLSAERDVADAIEFEPELVEAAAADPEIAELMEAQQQQFDARRKVQAEEEAGLVERKTQISNQIEGLEALYAATEDQIELLSREIESQETLLAQGLTQLTRVLTPQRELARLEGSYAQVAAAISENRAKIAETEIERIRLTSKTRETAIAELRDLEFREIELRERRLALKDEIAKLQLRAPVGGVIYGSTADTIRGVIRPAEPVLYIVPEEADLVIRARVEPVNVDKVHPGQEATLRFSAFDMRTTPEVPGHVTQVSADALEDPQTRMRYFLVDIAIDPGSEDKLGHVTLVPGMPVEAFIKTEDRSALTYFVKPLTDYFAQAFRES
jgi:HlyD family secretion protein